MSEPKYKEGQIVKIKSCEELKSYGYHLLYSDNDLKDMADAEVAIYKVENNQGVITKYQVGQLGRNLIDIPEEYIKCEVCLEQSPELMSEKGNSLQNFYEFSNQVRAGVCNGEYRHGDMEGLLKECLVALQDQKSKEEKDKMRQLNDDLQSALSKFQDFIISSISKDNSKLKPGMLYYESGGEFIIKEMGYPSILKAIEQPSNVQESKSISDFKRVKKWLEKHYKMDCLWMYANHYRTMGIENNCRNLERSMGDLKISIDSDNTDAVLNHLASLLSQVVLLIIITENPTETDNALLTKAFYNVTERMLALYCRKNKDYGDYFAESLDENGLLVAKIHIGEKANRYCTLNKNGRNTKVKDETLVDTLIDMANYSVMTIMWIEDQMDKSQKE